MEDGRPIRVVIADDHPVFRFGLRAVLLAEPETELVGEAETGQEAVATAIRLLPEIVLMDLNMPGISGIEATRRIAAAQPAIGILVLTMLEDEGSIFSAMQAGARGYLLKGAGSAEIMRAIRAVVAGETIFGPGMAERLIRHFATAPATTTLPGLTPREREILALLAAGQTNAAIADRLFLSPKTVRNNVSNIFAKLQVSGRGEAIVRAREAGFG